MLTKYNDNIPLGSWSEVNKFYVKIYYSGRRAHWNVNYCGTQSFFVHIILFRGAKKLWDPNW